MCFSATASFMAGGALSATGILTIKQAKKKSELPFASIPLLFGIQQITEGVIWLSFASPLLNTAMTYVYSIFSHVLWPIFVPFAVLLIESNAIRRKILKVCSLIGLMIGLYLLYFILKEPVVAHIVDNSIAYYSPHFYPFLTVTLYLLATSVSCLFSSHNIIKLLGVVLIISFWISYWFYNATFFSVWCFFAAIISVLVYIHFKSRVKFGG